MALLREYFRPETVGEAVALLRRTDARLLPLAGGSRLIGELETRARRDVDGVIDLAGLGLDKIGVTLGVVHLGATATLSDVAAHPVAGTLAGGILRRTAQAEGPVNLRNAASVGGAVAAAESDSEFYAALLALDAQVVLNDGETETTVPLAQLSPGDLAGRLITGVEIPVVNQTSGHARVARTPSDRPIVAAVAVVGDGVERIAVCGVASRPVLSTDAFDPVTDFKGSAEYRSAMAEVVMQRALAEAKGG